MTRKRPFTDECFCAHALLSIFRAVRHRFDLTRSPAPDGAPKISTRWASWY